MKKSSKVFFKISTLLVSFFVFVSCNNTLKENSIEKEFQNNIKIREEALMKEDVKKTKEDIVLLIDLYSEYADKYPESDSVANYLYKSAQLCEMVQLYPKAIQFLDRIIDNHTDFNKLEDCYFTKAFIYDNYLKNIPKARESYEAFVDKYPDSQLAADAELLIELLDKDLNEIVKQFESETAKK